MSRRKERKSYIITYETIKDVVIEELMTNQRFKEVPDIRLVFCNPVNQFRMRINRLIFIDEWDERFELVKQYHLGVSTLISKL